MKVVVHSKNIRLRIGETPSPPQKREGVENPALSKGHLTSEEVRWPALCQIWYFCYFLLIA